MTTGPFTSHRFPYLPIRIAVRRRTADLEALLDTGFDGHVVVPPSILANGHPPDGHVRWTLADGSTVLAPYYIGTVQVGTMRPFAALITALGDEPLIGCEVASHFTITLDHGQRVIVEP